MSFVDELKKWAEQLAREAAPIDPAKFNDPAALKTEWTPLARGGASFRTHRLVELGSEQLGMKKSLKLYLFGGVFLVIGLTVSVFAAVSAAWPALLVGLPFTAVGAAFVWPRTLAFDGSMRQFTSRKPPVPFSTIQAIQLLKEFVRTKNSSYHSYELNLVLTDGTRVNVVDHADLPSIRADAERIRRMIGCKLWDGTT